MSKLIEGGTELILDTLIKIQREEEQDATILIAGKEGIGKSTLLLWFIEYWLDKNNIKITKATAEKLVANHISLNIEQFIQNLNRLPSKSIVSLDEGKKLSSIRTAESIVKDIAEAFTVMRKKGLITIICFTNPTRMTYYFKEDRVIGLFLVVKRGIIKYYDKERLNKIINETNKDNNK